MTRGSTRNGRHEPDPDDTQLTLHEAADQLGVHYATIRRWIDNGLLQAYRQGPRMIRIYQSDLDKMIQPAVPLSVRKAAEKRAATRGNTAARKRGQQGRK